MELKIEHKKVIDNLVNKLKQFDQINTILLVGSGTTKKDYKDIDIIIISDSDFEFTKTASELNLKNPYLNLDALRYKLSDGSELSIVLKNTDEFAKRIKMITSGDQESLSIQYVNWAIGGYFPEAYLNDLANSEYLYKKNTEIDLIISKIKRDYPTKMKEGIIDLTNNEIKARIDGFNKFDKRIKINVIAELKISMYRQIFARKEIYCSGFRKFDKYLKNWSSESDILNSILNIDDKTTKVELNKVFSTLSSIVI